MVIVYMKHSLEPFSLKIKMTGLPEISKMKPQLMGPQAAKVSTQNSPSFLEDSGLELRPGSISRPSTASSARGWVANSPSGSARYTPSPPPRSSLATARRSLEFIRVSKSELERTEEALSSLRSDAVQMQAEIRRLQHYEQDFTTLQCGCTRVAEALGCSLVGGVVASAIQDILLSRVNSLVESQQQDSLKCDKYCGELEQTQGELAAAKVQLTSLENNLKKTRKQEKHLEADLQQAKSELETLRQSCARTGSTVESLRQQLVEVQGKVGKNQRESSCELTQLQTDVGRLRKDVTEKDDMVKGFQEQLCIVEEDKKNIKERLSLSEAMHADFCAQLAMSLQLDSTDSLDMDHLLTQVSSVVAECEELRLRCETLTGSIQTAELDSKASRETILRLVSESKKQERVKEEVARLQSEVDENKASLIASEQERAGLQERLTAAKDTMVSLEREIQAKDERLSEVCRNMEVCKLASDSSKSLSDNIQTEYDELVDSVGASLSIHSSDVSVLLQGIQELMQTCSKQSEELQEQQSLLKRHEESLHTLQESCQKMEADMKRERSSKSKLEGEVGALEVVREGLAKDLDKCSVFTRKVAQALALDRATAEILTGDFAHDAIIMKAEQLAKLESEALLSKQTTLYSLQCKLKACKQTLQSKELHLSLLQKKVETQEQSLRTASRRETDWEADISKMKKVEKKLETLEGKIQQQRETISQLESDNAKLQRLKESCYQLEKENVKLTTSKEELDHACSKQNKQLTESRQQAKQRQARADKERDTLRAELDTLNTDMERLKAREQTLSVFKTAVQRLLLSYHDQETAAEEGEATPSDYYLIATLEKVVGSQKKHKDNTKCLEASLRQLELGFKTNYKDTLTILSSD